MTADGNWLYHADRPDFSTVLAVVVEVGSEHANYPGPGKGAVEIKGWQIS